MVQFLVCWSEEVRVSVRGLHNQAVAEIPLPSSGATAFGGWLQNTSLNQDSYSIVLISFPSQPLYKRKPHHNPKRGTQDWRPSETRSWLWMRHPKL